MPKWVREKAVKPGDVIALPDGRMGTVESIDDNGAGWELSGTYGAHTGGAAFRPGTELFQGAFKPERWKLGPLRSSHILIVMEGSDRPSIAEPGFLDRP